MSGRGTGRAPSVIARADDAGHEIAKGDADAAARSIDLLVYAVCTSR
jgi:hypothetical protein